MVKATGSTEHIPPESTILIPDDFSISGSQIAYQILDSRSGFIDPAKRFKTKILLLQSHPKARSLIAAYGGDVLSIGPDIIRLEEIITPEDVAFLNRLLEQEGRGDDILEDDSLFFTWYKLPDNIPKVFTRAQYRLFDPQDFREPYRP